MDHFGECPDFGRTDPTIQIFVQHGGEWIDNTSGIKTYCSSKATEIMYLPRDCTYKNLVGMVHAFFNLSPALHHLTMTYGCKTSVGIVVLHIRNDTDIQHFLRFNMRADGTTPLCLLIDGGPYDFPLQSDQCCCPSVGVNPNISMHAHGSSNGNTHMPASLGVSAQGEPIEDSRGIKDKEQHELGENCSPDDQGPGEVHSIEEEDILLPNVCTSGPQDDCNNDNRSVAGEDGMSVKDLVGSVRPNTSYGSRASSMLIEKNQKFSNKMELRRYVSLYALTHNFEFKVYRSTRQLFVAKCVIEGCKWKVRATKLPNLNSFRVCKIIPDHSCSQDIIHHDHRQASSWLIGHCIKSRYERAGCIYKPKHIIDDIRKEFGVNISYDKAWRARVCALDSMRRKSVESYAILPSYCAMLESKNSGSVIAIQTDEANHFKYFFMSIGACIKGFDGNIRPVIAIDGAFLKEKYLGTLFMAACLDGNNQVYPIAFGIGDSKNDASWEWFMLKLSEIISEEEGLVFISALDSSIEKAIKKVFPQAIHGLCIYHLSQNLKSKFKKGALIPLFNTAAKLYRTLEFNEMMREIGKCDADAAKYLTEIGVERWARAYFDGRRYNILTINSAECLDTILKDARELPINMLIDHLRGFLQVWFYERRTIAANMKCFLVDWAESEVGRRAKMSAWYQVRSNNCHEMEVFDGDRKVLVNLHNKKCSCREFDLDQLPCAHALAVARYCHNSVNDLCSHFYTTTCLVAAYTESIHPVGNQVDWEIPDDVRSRVVLPPLMHRSSEKRKKPQISSASDGQQTRKCGRCQGIGHNRKTCTKPIFLAQGGAAST